jgi:hypothetical protein
MTPRDYREAWSWVHFLLKESGESRAVLLGYLGDLRNHAEAGPISRRLASPAREESTALLRHLEKVRKGEPAKLAVEEPMVRLQDVPIDMEPIGPSTKKRGFFSRLFGRLDP